MTKLVRIYVRRVNEINRGFGARRQINARHGGGGVEVALRGIVDERQQIEEIEENNHM